MDTARILLVDDHASNRQLLKGMLGNNGYRFLEACDGVEALEVLAREPVFITADYLEKDARILAEACGVAHYMTKPINLPLLQGSIDLLLREPGAVQTCPSENRLLHDYAQLLANKLHRQLGALSHLNAQLELRVEERTRQLNMAVTALEREIARREAAEEALRLSNVRLTEEALHDSLTCLYNRRYLELSLERTLQRCAHDGKMLGVMMIDFDHFKHCNDNYGHVAGDVVLVEVSRYLQSLVRSEDMLCRYGGEELLLVMQAGSEVLWERAEALRKGVQALTIAWEGRELPRVTVSVGLALFPEHGRNGAELIQAADSALYAAKQRGRNCTVLCNQAGLSLQ